MSNENGGTGSSTGSYQRRVLALIPIQTSHSSIDDKFEHTTRQCLHVGPRPREHKPWINLFSPTSGTLRSDGEESVVLGRKELLRAFHATCPQRQQYDQRSLCERCQQIKEWGMTSLSRSMIKITQIPAISNTNEPGNLPRNVHQYQIQVHGQNAFLIRVNDVPVVDSNSERAEESVLYDKHTANLDVIPWKGACWVPKPLENRTIISVGSNLNFEFKEIEYDLDYNCVSSTKSEVTLSVSKIDTEAENPRIHSQLTGTVTDCAGVPFIDGTSLPHSTCISHGLKTEKSHLKKQEWSSEPKALPQNTIHSHIAENVTIESITVQTMDAKQQKAFSDNSIESHILECASLDTPATKPNDSQQKRSYLGQEASSFNISANVGLNVRNQNIENRIVAESNGMISGQGVSPASLEDHQLSSDNLCGYPEAAGSGVQTSALRNKSCAGVENIDREKPNSFVIYILPLGRKLPRQRIEILTRKMMRIPNVTIVSSVASNCKNPLQFSQHFQNKITHIVIDETVPINDVVTYFECKSEEELLDALAKENITAVTPDWIIQCPDCSMTLLQEPLLNQIWHTLNVSMKKPKVTGWFQRKKYLQDSDRFGSIKYVKASEVAENNSVISMISKKRKNSAADQDSISPTFGEAWKNVKLAGMFEQLSKLHADMPLEDGDQWRAYTFAVIASRLRHLEFEVDPSVLKQLEGIKGFGKSVMTKIKEFFSTGGSCERIRQFTCDETRIAMRNMMNIWGVGRVKAKMLVDDGFTDILQIRQALKNKKLVLSRNALIGVDYYEDFNEKMCRSEVSTIRDICFEFCAGKFPDCELTAMGSFRRGESHCSDVDIIILDREYETSTPKGALWWLVDKLMREGHIAHHLTHWDHDANEMEGTNYHTFRGDANDSNSNLSGRNFSECADKCIGKISGVQSYMGVFNSPLFSGKKRRIDIKFYPYKERAFAFLYFTGNTLFNRSIRQYATQVKAMKLSNRDLRPILREPFSLGRPLKAFTEKDVFDILGLVYRDPSQRDGFDAVIPIERSKRVEFLNHSLDIATSEN